MFARLWDRLTGADRKRAYSRLMLNIRRAVEIDPEAFPPGCIVAYWPKMTDPRQARAIYRAERERWQSDRNAWFRAAMDEIKVPERSEASR